MKKSIGAKTILYPTPVLVVGTYDKDGKPNAMTTPKDPPIEQRDREAEPRTAEVEIVTRGKLRVAAPKRDMPSLSTRIVGRTRDRIRKDRG